MSQKSNSGRPKTDKQAWRPIGAGRLVAEERSEMKNIKDKALLIIVGIS